METRCTSSDFRTCIVLCLEVCTKPSLCRALAGSLGFFHIQIWGLKRRAYFFSPSFKADIAPSPGLTSLAVGVWRDFFTHCLS